MDINELNTKFEKEDIDSLDSGGISFQLSLDETPELVSKNSDVEINQALSEQMIEDLTIDELKSVIGQLNLKKHDSDKGLINVDQLASVLNEAPPELAAEVLRGIDWYHASQVISKIRDMEGVGKLYKYQKPSDDFMKHDFVAIRSAWSVSHTVSVLRKSNISSNKLQNLFVVDAKGKLVGSINICEFNSASF